MDMDIGRRLRELHEDYIVLVNLAVEEGRECDIDARATPTRPRGC